ncbi:hypothetical protein ACIQXA_26285 [Streptomyces massasporeus]|uniref:hypothetical protein n=1 Tax=Streptomyces massasporeus TaxID=67324 RepID=UPI00380E2639
MFRFTAGLIDGSPVVAVLALALPTGPVPLRQLLLFLGFRGRCAARGRTRRVCRSSPRNSAALTARRARGERRK